jgi:histidine triad (HIT) family protein
LTRDPDCIFCRIVAGEIPSTKVWEDDDTIAFMDINPAHPGHVLVIPKAHHTNLFETPDAVLGPVLATARRVARAVHRALAPDGLNLVQANGPGAAQSVEHFHVHVLPRRIGDDLRLNWGLKAGDMEAIADQAAKIRAAIGDLD